jgi:uncharacterized protein (TIGR00251 family)
MKKWLKNRADGVIIKLHVIPNAKKTILTGEYNNTLKIKVSSPPVDGSANKEIKKFFSEMFNVSKNKVEIIKGEKSRQKEILIREKIEKISEVLKNADIRI